MNIPVTANAVLNGDAIIDVSSNRLRAPQAITNGGSSGAAYYKSRLHMSTDSGATRAKQVGLADRGEDLPGKVMALVVSRIAEDGSVRVRT
jgi:hypothetical protein